MQLLLKFTSSRCKYHSASPERKDEWYLILDSVNLSQNQWCAPCATSDQVHLVQVQVPLGFASWYLHLALVDLIQSL